MSHPQPAVLSAVQQPDDEWAPHSTEEFQQVGTVGKIAIGLLGASTVTHLLSTWSDWNTYSVVHRYLGGMPNVDDADLNRADAIAKFTAIPNVIISVAAAVVFVIWLWRARVNSEVFCQADHRRSHGWVLASWFVPGPNLWYPKQIVDDVWLASDSKTPVYADDLRRFRTPTLTSVWWVAWIGALTFDVVVRRFLMWMEASVGSLRGIAFAGTASLVLTGVSAVAATLVIRKITAMQTEREWTPWWDQREPKLTAVPTYANDDTDEQPAIAEPIAVSAQAGLVSSPTRRLERQPELQLAGGGAAPPVGSPFAAEAAPPAASPFAAAASAFPGDGAAAGSFPGGSPFGADEPAEEAPKWSPFAPVAESWQDNAQQVDAGPSTEQFDAVSTWQDDTSSPTEQTAYQPLKPSWSEFLGSTPDEDPLAAAKSRWMSDEPARTSIQPDPYAYQPEQQADPEPSWASSYSEPYTSYESTSDYLTSTAQNSALPSIEPAPEPEPAPVARAGRRAARVAVDSPSVIQEPHSVYPPSQSHQTAASAGYYEPAPVLAPQDDFLTPSKPLPSVPEYGPEPSYTPETPSYGSDYSSSSYEPSSYQSYETPATDYTSSYSSEYTSTSSYDSTQYGYNSDYTSSAYEPPAPAAPAYDAYTPTSYSGSEYSSTTEPTSSYDSYSYGTEPSYGQQPAEEYPTYTPEEPSQPEPPTGPRTHPRRRWT
ncbi:DUF4328 domain-containing protein [Kribbella albertanoniae]|uniref:DUF4328 domain-containing protein n=1 Tax=Kribbella albertanoniae TaxID=1266829 RepID=A0A4R4Q3G0_9ACTN|nr:DUF4328 domain-containing protein [Kribbella albertanoniae]TDC29596.1 DUF4328 domain-containing protein [Kribbella albertanoniae]